MKNNKLLYILGIVTIAALIAAYFVAKNRKDKSGKEVEIQAVAKRTIIQTVTASGKIYPEEEVKISSDVSGEIIELTVKEGDIVHKGQLLARIKPESYQAVVEQSVAQLDNTKAQLSTSKARIAQANAIVSQAQAQYETSQAAYTRAQELFSKKIISKADLESAESAYKTSKANVESAKADLEAAKHTSDAASYTIKATEATIKEAKINLNKTTIYAPMDGIISLLNVKKGEKVAGNSFNVGTEMMRIADMNKIEVRVDVPENDIVKVQLGDTALIEVEAYSNRKFKGIVTKIASSNNGAATAGVTSSNDVTQYKVNILLLAESYMDLIGKGSFPFRPGMSASADIQTETHTNVLSVPINAVTTRDKNDSTKTEKKKIDATDAKAVAAAEDDLEVVVFVLNKDNTIKKVKVKTAIQDINNIEITEGLNKDEMVITGPYDVVSKTLKVGTRVKVVDKKDLYDKQ